MTKTIVQCPQCGQPVPWQDDQVWKPFCSERCKLIDLGDWASDNHRIAGEPAFIAEDDSNNYH